MKKSINLRRNQVEEIIELLRNPSLRNGRELADQLQERIDPPASYYVCLGCGKSFEQNSTGRPRKTCGDSCRQRALRRRRGMQDRSTKTHLWADEEVEKLIDAVNTYRGNQHWIHQQRTFVWGAVASELGRTPASVASKWSELLRKGIVKDGTT